jgi:hypothetical protein
MMQEVPGGLQLIAKVAVTRLAHLLPSRDEAVEVRATRIVLQHVVTRSSHVDLMALLDELMKAKDRMEANRHAATEPSAH